MADLTISPTVMLGMVLFIVILLVVRFWLLQDDRDRRNEQDRRRMSDEPAFPFYDGEGSWVTAERRQRMDRRQMHTFITSQGFHPSE